LSSAFVATLNDSRLPYCLLGAPENPLAANSDVDFAVHSGDYRHIPQLLASAAASVGGQLVQAIEHETTATYFALALQQHGRVAFLHPDCTADYRRQGRLWMSSEELLRGSWRAPGGYYRPAPDTDFKYYLTKQVLKQSVTDGQWRKLLALYQAADDPRGALSWWRLPTAAQIDQSLRHHDRQAFGNLVPHLRRELIQTPSTEGVVARASSCAFETARVVKRLVNPTGLFVRIRSGSPEQRSKLAGNLADALAPAFRHSSVVAFSNPARLRTLIESTVVLAHDQMVPFRKLYAGVDIHWQPAATTAQNVEWAITSILSHLAQRTVVRLKLQSPLSPPMPLDTLAHTPVS